MPSSEALSLAERVRLTLRICPLLKRERAQESSGKCGGASLTFATRRRGWKGRVSEDESCLSSGEKLATRRKRSESAFRRPGQLREREEVSSEFRPEVTPEGGLSLGSSVSLVAVAPGCPSVDAKRADVER